MPEAPPPGSRSERAPGPAPQPARSPRPAGPSPETTAAPTRSRNVGIDVARGLALIGMFVAHAAPAPGADASSLAQFFLTLPDERSRLLFAVTAGLGLGMLTGGVRPPGRRDRTAAGRSRRGVLRGQLAIRAVFLIALGFLLTATGALLYVILDDYGVAFLLALPLLFLPPWVLIGVGAATLAVVPGVVAVLAQLPTVVGWTVPGSSGGPALATLADWFITGPYPVGVWLGVFCLGIAVVRLDLRRPAVVLGTFAGGAAAMILGLGLSAALGGDGMRVPVLTGSPWLVGAGHSLFTIGNVGFGFALTAGLVALTALAAPGIVRVSSILLAPLAAAGSMPLSVYSVHVLVLAATIHPGPGGAPTDDSWTTVAALTAGSLAGAWLWRRFVGRGPLEWAVGVLSGRIPAPGGGDRTASPPIR